MALQKYFTIQTLVLPVLIADKHQQTYEQNSIFTDCKFLYS